MLSGDAAKQLGDNPSGRAVSRLAHLPCHHLLRVPVHLRDPRLTSRDTGRRDDHFGVQLPGAPLCHSSGCCRTSGTPIVCRAMLRALDDVPALCSQTTSAFYGNHAEMRRSDCSNATCVETFGVRSASGTVHLQSQIGKPSSFGQRDGMCRCRTNAMTERQERKRTCGESNAFTRRSKLELQVTTAWLTALDVNWEC